MTRSTLRRTALLAAALALTLLAAPATPAFAQLNGDHPVPGVLRQVSRKAQAAIVIPSLTRMNQRIADLREALNLPVPEMDDALGAFKRDAGIENGLNHNGAMAIVLEDLDRAIGEKDTRPTALILLPVSDYAAFVGNFDGTADEAVTEVTMPRHTGFARQLGDYALLGEKRDAVANYQPTRNVEQVRAKLGDFGKRYLAEAEAALYVDIEKLRPALAPKLDESRQQMMRQMGAQGGPNAEAGRAMVDLYIDGMRAVLDSASAAVIALDLADDGVALSKAFRYEADSPLAEVFPGNATQTEQAMARLPQQTFLFAMGMDTRAFAAGTLVENVLNALPEDVDNPMLALYAQALPLVEQVNATAGAYYAPTRQTMMGGNMISAVNIYRVDDTKQYLRETKAYLENINGLSAPVGGNANNNRNNNAPGGGGAQGQITVSAGYTENALNIDGVQVDQYRFNMNYPPQMQQQMAQMGPLASMFGMQGYNGYAAATGDYVILTTRTDAQLVRNAIDTINSGEGIGTDTGINDVRAMLPPDPALEMYLSVRGLAQTANLYLPMFGMPEIDTPADIPPIGMGVSVQDNSLAGRLYVPHRAVRFMVDTGKSISQQLGGGNQQGGQQNRGGAQPPPF